MEVVGVLASFIAIGQAIESGPRTYRFLRSIVNPGKEVAELAAELERMEGYYAYISDIIKPHVDAGGVAATPVVVAEHPYMMRLRLEMEDFSQQLRSRFNGCTTFKDKLGNVKVMRRRWFMDKKDIMKLRDTCARLTRELEAAMGPYALLTQRNYAQVTLDLMSPPEHASITDQGGVIENGGKCSSPPGMDKNEKESVYQAGDNIQYNKRDTYPGGTSNLARCTPSYAVATRQPQQLPKTRCGRHCHKRRKYPDYSDHQTSHTYLPTLSITEAELSCQGCGCEAKATQVRFRFRYPSWRMATSLEICFTWGRSGQIGKEIRCVVEIRDSRLEESLFRPHGDAFLFSLAQSGFSMTDTLNGHELYKWMPFYLPSSLIGRREMVQLALERTNRSSRSSVAAFFMWFPDQKASPGGDTREVLRKVALVFDDDAEDDDGSVAVYEAIHRGDDLTKIKEWSREDLITYKSVGGGSFLDFASKAEHTPPALRQLLWLGADIEATDFSGKTALQSACSIGCTESVSILIDSGANLERKDNAGATALLLAAGTSEPQSVEIMNLLLERGGSPTTRGCDGQTVLHHISQQLYADTNLTKQKLELLFRYGADSLLDAPSKKCPPVLEAVRWHNHLALQCFLDAGARINATDCTGYNVIHYAAQFGTREVMELLQHVPIADIDIRTPVGNHSTPLNVYRWRFLYVKNKKTCEGTFKTTDEMNSAFEQLLRVVRDREVHREAQRLRAIVELLHQAQIEPAQNHIREICSQKTAACIYGDAETFRAINLQIQLGMIEAAVESLEEFNECSYARLQVRPYEEWALDPVSHYQFNPHLERVDCQDQDESYP